MLAIRDPEIQRRVITAAYEKGGYVRPYDPENPRNADEATELVRRAIQARDLGYANRTHSPGIVHAILSAYEAPSLLEQRVTELEIVMRRHLAGELAGLLRRLEPA